MLSEKINKEWERFIGEVYRLMMNASTDELLEVITIELPKNDKQREQYATAASLRQHIKYRAAAEVAYRASEKKIDCLQHRTPLKDCIYSHV